MATHSAHTFGTLLRQYRLARGLTQEELAERALLSERAVSDLERGVKRKPYRDTVRRLAEALDLPSDDRDQFERAARADRSFITAGSPSDGRPHATIFVPRFLPSVTGHLVGREGELQTILAACPSRVASKTEEGPARPRLLLVGAEAGMGKTRLLAEVAARARAAGLLTLAGGCYEQEGRLPYGPFHDALIEYVEMQPEGVIRAQLEEVLSDLVRILPELRSYLGVREAVRSGDPESQRLRLFAAVGQSLERIVEATPLVLLLDDLHWADDASLHLLPFLMRQPHLTNMLVLGTYREEEVSRGTPLDHLATEAEIAQWAQRLSLCPLDEANLGVILQDRLGGPCAPDFVESLRDRSAGNPFFALQMLQLMQQEGKLVQAGAGWRLSTVSSLNLPAAVRETVERRLPCASDEREILMLGAVLQRSRWRISKQSVTTEWPSS